MLRKFLNPDGGMQPGIIKGGVSCSVDLLIVEALEIAAKMRLRRLVYQSTVGNCRTNTHPL